MISPFRELLGKLLASLRLAGLGQGVKQPRVCGEGSSEPLVHFVDRRPRPVLHQPFDKLDQPLDVVCLPIDQLPHDGGCPIVMFCGEQHLRLSPQEQNLNLSLRLRDIPLNDRQFIGDKLVPLGQGRVGIGVKLDICQKPF